MSDETKPQAETTTTRRTEIDWYSGRRPCRPGDESGHDFTQIIESFGGTGVRLFCRSCGVYRRAI